MFDLHFKFSVLPTRLVLNSLAIDRKSILLVLVGGYTYAVTSGL